MNEKAKGYRFPGTQNRSERGQTLVVALIILGILLILGFVFLGVINRNLTNSTRLYGRSVANDYAEAGIRYAHSQLLNSPLGADWRGTPTALSGVSGNLTTDPDALYLRPPTGLAWPAAPTQRDLGGPDGLGFYVRINYPNGRSLVRVRWAPTDANVLASSPIAALRTAGQRNYLILESVGRSGAVSNNDPTRTAATGPVQYTGFSDTAQLQQALARMRQNDQQIAGSRRLRAFASIGIIESARYVTNKDRVSQAVELGIPDDLGARVGNQPIVGNANTLANLPLQVGTTLGLLGVPGSGGIQINGDVSFEGHVIANLNRNLGDRINVAGAISAAPTATLTLVSSAYNGSAWNTVPTSIAGTELDSRNPAFDTFQGLLTDGMASTDTAGYTRASGRKEPPSILTADPDTGELRYRTMSRESGQAVQSTVNGVTQVVNSGMFGHGHGVYVNNFSDSQTGADETARANSGADESLVNDWLNPGNSMSRSGWKGPFYVAPAAYVELRSDGVIITRNGSGPDEEKFWRARDGSLPKDGAGNTIQTNQIRYRIGIPSGSSSSQPYIVNTFTPGVNINADTPDYSLGQPFNGVLFFEGNVRVRGVIPTDVQMSIVSMGTIYIEGSVTKGVTGNGVTAGYPSTLNIGSQQIAFPYPTTAPGVKLTRPSRSELLLAARDYVAVNPTMFFGPSPNTQLEVVSGAADSGAIRVRASDPTRYPRFTSEFALDPTSAQSPNNWLPYAYEYGYTDTDGTVQNLVTRLLLTHSMDEGSASATFLSMNVNPILGGGSEYYFQRVAQDWADTSAAIYPPFSIFASNLAANLNITGNPAYSLLYGMGGEPFQRYANFETVGFPLVNNAAGPGIYDSSTGTIRSDVTPDWDGDNPFTLFTQAASQPTNEFLLRPNSADAYATNDYLLSRAAIVPHDIRIEATIFAENGSFFVIPGQWFNPNPNDTRAKYEQDVANLGDRRQADDVRLREYGTTPIAPFFGEPVDVRIQIVGAISENLPPAMSQQAEWLRKWGWIPRQLGAMYNYSRNREIPIPDAHVAGTISQGVTDPTDPRSLYVPNLIVQYDPVLGSGRANGFPANMTFRNDPFDSASPVVRWDDYARPLPPIPRLPVSPALAYFGEVK